MNIFLGDYTSLTPGSSHETYKCINTTKNNHNFDLICLEELTSCPEVNAFMVNQDNKTYASVIMEAKKVQIRYSMISCRVRTMADKAESTCQLFTYTQQFFGVFKTFS